MIRQGLLGLIMMIGMSPTLHAEVLMLTNGDRLTGVIIHTNQESVVMKSDAFGTIAVRHPFIAEQLPDSQVQDILVPKTEPDREAVKEKPKIWDGKVYGGFNRTRGNTKSTELSGGFLFHRKVEKKNEFHVKADTYYSATDRKMNAQKHLGMVRFAYSFGESKKWYNFYKTEADRDRFANINARITPSSGVGYWFWDKEDLKLMAEAGGGVTHTDYRDETDSETELVLTPRVFGEVKLLDRVTVSEDATMYPSLTDRGEYRLVFDTSGVAQFTDQWGIRVSWINEYNTDPGPDTKEHDMRLVSSLEFSF